MESLRYRPGTSPRVHTLEAPLADAAVSLWPAFAVACDHDVPSHCRSGTPPAQTSLLARPATQDGLAQWNCRMAAIGYVHSMGQSPP